MGFTHISKDGVQVIFVEAGLRHSGVLLEAQRVLKHRSKLDTESGDIMHAHTCTHTVTHFYSYVHTPAESWIQLLSLQSSPRAWSRMSRWIALYQQQSSILLFSRLYNVCVKQYYIILTGNIQYKFFQNRTNSPPLPTVFLLPSVGLLWKVAECVESSQTLEAVSQVSSSLLTNTTLLLHTEQLPT